MKKFTIIILAVSGLTVIYLFFKKTNEEEERGEILRVLKNQETCWNKADIDCFMEGYWQSDSLVFISSNGISHGFTNTLEGYKKRYPDKDAMGRLSFEIMEIRNVSSDVYLVVGKFFLERENLEDLNGIFTLTFRKVLGDWVIVADHTGSGGE